MEEWLEFSLETTAENIDTLTDQLMARGVSGLVIEDGADFKKFLAENQQYWDYVDEDLMEKMAQAHRVKYYVANTSEGRGEGEALCSGLPAVVCTVTPLKEEDWANGWKRYYQPMEVGKRLYVVPQWLPTQPPAGRVSLILNPGLTFGTGSHPSTQLCLEGVEQYTASGDAVLDLGCGSGILSIAALQLGAGHVVGVDIDPKSVDVAYENAALNGIDRSRYQVLAGNVLGDATLAAQLGCKKYQLILANIVADVIIPLSAVVGDWLTPGGHFLTSGIIDTRADEVADAIRSNGFEIIDTRTRKGWVAFMAVMQ